MKFKCAFCELKWKLGQMKPCGCHKQVPNISLWCPQRDHFISLQICTTCQKYDECPTREEAQLKHLMADELPKKRIRRKVRRGAIA